MITRVLMLLATMTEVLYGAIEGHYTDYMVKSPFETNFVYSMFHKKQVLQNPDANSDSVAFSFGQM